MTIVTSLVLVGCTYSKHNEDEDLPSIPDEVDKEYNPVDLGLPSGLLWADRNVGADSPYECGNYFAWGEVETKDYFSWATYKWYNAENNGMNKYCTIADYGNVDDKTVLEPADDAATINMGKKWRMPTEEEQRELFEQCVCTWTTEYAIPGYKVTGPNGNSIFLPATGFCKEDRIRFVGVNSYYWSATLYKDYQYYSTYVFFNSDKKGNIACNNRYNGLAVRAVRR